MISATMRMREFNGRDLSRVLSILDVSTPQDRLSAVNFRQKVILQEGFDLGLCLVAEQDEDIIGFIFAPMRKDVGYVNIIAVRPDWRRKGIGTALLHEIEKRQKERGARRIVVSGGPRYVVPGVDVKAYPTAIDFFLKNGFNETNRDSVSMYRTLMDYDVPEQILELERRLSMEGFTFQQLDDEHLVDLIHFLKRELPGWDEDLRKTLDSHPDKLDWVTIALKDQKVVGYCQIATDGLIEHFGPFAVSSDLRGRGIGAVIFHRCLKTIQSMGAKNVWFAWGGGRNYRFYSRHGMIEGRRFAILVKEI